MPPSEGEDEYEIDFEKLEDYILLKVRDYVYGCKSTNGGTVANTPPEEKSKLAIAQKRTASRLNDIKKQIQGVDKCRTLTKGMVVAVNPDPDYQDPLGFWLAKVNQNPAKGLVDVQWFELSTSEPQKDETKYYVLSTGISSISVHSIYIGLNIRLEYSEEKNLYFLENISRFKEELQRLDNEG